MKTTIALVGNPNSGKTTLFNVLAGANQYVGNWPGVTVEKKVGKYKKDESVVITDLPGIYSLSPYSPEEVVARNYLMEDRPDGILNIVDGSNLERNLYLTTQLMEMGIPVVVAINRMDVVRKRGDKISAKGISKKLGCPVVEISALKEEGITEAMELVIGEAREEKETLPRHIFSGRTEHALAHIEEAVLHHLPETRQRWYAIKLFERDEKVINEIAPSKEVAAHIEGDILRCEKEMDDDSESIITNERYDYIATLLEGCYERAQRKKGTVTDKIDRILTNRWAALPIFGLVMFAVYYISVTTVGTFVTDWANDGVFGEGWSMFGLAIPGIPALVESGLNAIHGAAWLQDLILNGIIAGVGAVLGFVPQLLVLFAFLSFLEYCGYMSRVAFILDRVFRRFGLSGKSFIPLLIGTGCGIPGIMASRTIENEKDRKMTIITTTFIPCGAKLPIIALIAGAFFGGAWWVAPSAYFLGIAAIMASGIILKKSRGFRGDASTFLMELPEYHMPSARVVLRSMWDRGWSFIKKAGTVILLATIVIWFTSNYGWKDGVITSVAMEDSILAAMGNLIAPIFAPLGWGDWKATVATITGLIAKENVVSTFGVLYGGVVGFTALSAYSFLVFNLLCAPCFAAVGAIRKEMNDWKWTLFAVAYQTMFAYGVALMIYQFGKFISTGGFTVGTGFAVIALIAFVYLLVRKERCPGRKEEKCYSY